LLKFEKDNTPWGFTPYRYTCSECGGSRLFHISNIGRPPVEEGWVCHLVYKCVGCFITVTHSPMISEKYKDELIRRRGGKPRFIVWKEAPELFYSVLDEAEKAEIKKRLSALGYF